jgi:hypothetical protein
VDGLLRERGGDEAEEAEQMRGEAKAATGLQPGQLVRGHTEPVTSMRCRGSSKAHERAEVERGKNITGIRRDSIPLLR